jgi:hypothetical protein
MTCQMTRSAIGEPMAIRRSFVSTLIPGPP